MRVSIALAMILFMLAATVQPAMAFSEISFPFITTDYVGFGFPNANTALTIMEFNSASTSIISSEKLNINFPLFEDGIVAGPTMVEGTSANIVPFGPVNLAFPSIAQSANETIACQRTYFFTDTF